MAKSTGSDGMRMFGELVKHLRRLHGISQEALAAHVGYSKALVAGVEGGTRMPSRNFILKAEEILRADGVLVAAAKHLAWDKYPKWFVEYVELEKKARALHTYENHVIPGLLQTEEYARAVFEAHCPPLDEEEIERRVAVRLERQVVFDRKPLPVTSFVLEMAVIARPIGGRKVQRVQLEQLLDSARRRNVEIQLMPPDRETHVGLDGSFVLLETVDRRNVAYVEGQHGSRLFEDPEKVSDLTARYGILRAQALSPEESARLIEQVAKE